MPCKGRLTPFQGPSSGKSSNPSIKANERLAECLARQRLESRGALHQAWSEAADASRKAAALERRLQEGRAGHGDLGQTKEEMFGTKGIYALENEHFEHYHGGLVQMIFVFKGAIFLVPC